MNYRQERKAYMQNSESQRLRASRWALGSKVNLCFLWRWKVDHPFLSLWQNTWAKELKRRKIYFGLWFQRFLLKANCLPCFCGCGEAEHNGAHLLAAMKRERERDRQTQRHRDTHRDTHTERKARVPIYLSKACRQCSPLPIRPVF
jgi:hypothetical protein